MFLQCIESVVNSSSCWWRTREREKERERAWGTEPIPKTRPRFWQFAGAAIAQVPVLLERRNYCFFIDALSIFGGCAAVCLSVCPAPGGGDDAGCGSQPVTCELQPREETGDMIISRGMSRGGNHHHSRVWLNPKSAMWCYWYHRTLANTYDDGMVPYASIRLLLFLNFCVLWGIICNKIIITFVLQSSFNFFADVACNNPSLSHSLELFDLNK